MRRGIIAAVLAPVWLAAAAAAPPVEVVAGRVEVARVGLTSADVVLYLVVANHGPTVVTLRDLAYRTTLDGAPFRAGRMPGPLRIAARSRIELPLAAEIGYGEAGGKALGLLTRGKAAYRVAGSVRVEGPPGAETLVFDESGTIGVTGAR